MNTANLKDRIRRILDGKNRVKVYTFLGIAAILLILISELIPSSKKPEKTNNETEKSFDTGRMYAAEVEERLTRMLSEIKDVGRAEVILSTEGTEEYIYAEEVSTDSTLRGEDHSEKNHSKLVLAERSGTKEPLLRKVMMPRFNGALIICDGGGDIAVKERVIKAVSAALDLPTSKICVECRIR